MVPQYDHTAKSRRNFRIKGTISIGAPREKLWRIITTPGHLEYFHPFVKEHGKAEKWNGVGAKDYGVFNNGKRLNRTVIDWKEGSGYKIKMEHDDTNKTFVCFVLTGTSPTQTNFSVEIQTDSYRKIPRPIWKIFARYFLVPSFKKYLYSILKGLEYYTETGKKVRKNQFGRHRKFSP